MNVAQLRKALHDLRLLLADAGAVKPTKDVERVASLCDGREHQAIGTFLTELKRAIEDELNDPEYRQLELFNNSEKQQFERSKDALRTRAEEIPEEIRRETAAVRARFADPEPRMFPVAVTFLVPEKLSR